MANRNITLKRNNAGTTEELYPTTDWAQINNKPGTFAPTGHTHGNINDDGQISASAPIASGDHLVIADNSSNNDLTTSSITFGTGTTTFLRNDGTWGTPSGADGNNYLTGVSGSGDGTVTFTRTGLSNLTWDASHSHSEYLLTTGKAADSNLLDGIDSSAFLRSNADDTMTGDLLLSNAALSYQGQNGVAVPIPQGGLFATTSSTQTGYLKITLPVSWTSTMLSFFVDIYEYTADESFTIQLAGYNYSPNSQWINTTANLVSSSKNRVFNVRFGHDGSKCAIYIGESNSTWAYMQVRVRDFLGGYSNANPSNWADGWAVGFTTTLGTITSTQSLESVVTDADTVDSLHASQFVRSDADDTMSGVLTLGPNSTWSKYLKIGGNANHSDANTGSIGVTNGNLHLDAATSNITYLNYYDGTGGVTFGNGAGTVVAWMGPDGDLWKGSADNTGSKYWHAGNDGAGSGLAADTLDGQHGSYYAPLASPSFTGTPTAPTPAAGDDDTSIATTAFVQDAIESLVNGASASFDTLKEIQDAMATDTELSNAINNLTIGNGTQTITAGGGLTGGGVFYANQVGNSSVTVSHSDTSSQASVNNSGNTFIQDITLDTYGHITAITSATASTTDSTKLPLAGGTLTGDLVLDHDGTGTAADSHALRFTARAANTDFSREIKLEDGGGFAFDSNILLTGDVTTSNRARTIDFTGFDKEGTTDFSDRAYIQHTTNTGGHSGSVLVISSQNDASDGIAFSTNGSSLLKHNGNSIFTDGYHPNADKWTTARTLSLTGAVTGSVSWDGSGNASLATTATSDPTLTLAGDASGSATFTNLGNATLTVTVADDSHNHIISNVDGLQTALDGKASSSHTHSNYVAVSGDTMTGDLTLDHDGTGSAADSHGVVFTARFNSTDFTRELYMDDEANLLFGTNTIFHSGNDGSSSGLHADLLDGQQGSYYLDYNNFSNTPTIPTNNNQLTNGAGYVTGSHSHSTSNITSGEFNTARLGSGTATSGYVLKSDGDGTASWQQDNNTTYSLGSFGVTATAAELNKMDGVTATTTELNYTDGVTSNIQTQLNGKLSTSAAAAAVTYVTSCPTSTNSTGMKVYVGSTDCSTKYTGWLYIIT